MSARYLASMALFLLLFSGMFGYGANAVVQTGAGKNKKTNVIINIPAQRLRVYKGKECVLDCRTAVGKRFYAGVGRNTRTRVGSYFIRQWVNDYVNKSYPHKWSKNNWRGAFGRAAAKLSPRSAGQHIHGTVGPIELQDFYLDRMAPREKKSDESISHYERYVAGYEYGLSHGCTRLSNENIGKLKKLCPVGTKVKKIYCVHESFDTHNPWEIKDVYYPNIYRYKLDNKPVFFPDTGELKNYKDPVDAIGYY